MPPILGVRWRPSRILPREGNPHLILRPTNAPRATLPTACSPSRPENPAPSTDRRLSANSPLRVNLGNPTDTLLSVATAHPRTTRLHRDARRVSSRHGRHVRDNSGSPHTCLCHGLLVSRCSVLSIAYCPIPIARLRSPRRPLLPSPLHRLRRRETQHLAR